MSRHPHFAVDDLSEPARAIIRHGLDRNQREKAILAEVKKQTGEAVAPSSFNRYASWYRAEMRRQREIREKMEVAARIAIENGKELTDGVRAELLQTFYELARANELPKIGPFYVGLLAHKFTEADRKERELGLRVKHLDLEERKLKDRLARIREEAGAVTAAVEKKGAAQLTPEEIQKIRDIYGLAAE